MLCVVLNYKANLFHYSLLDGNIIIGFSEGYYC